MALKFKLHNRIDEVLLMEYGPGEAIDLESDVNIYVDPVSTALVTHHKMWIDFAGSSMVRRYGAIQVACGGLFLSHTLIIPCEHLWMSGSGRLRLSTPVFNFGTQRVRIEEGTIISRLVAL